MKKILSILFVSITIAVAYQSSSSDIIQIVGIWTLTDYNDPEKFEDIWEFTSDNVFNELKYKTDFDTTLVPDENGTWVLEGENLKVTVTGEDVGDEQKRYEKPQIMEFELIKEGEDYILDVIADGGASDGKTNKLRLTKK